MKSKELKRKEALARAISSLAMHERYAWIKGRSEAIQTKINRVKFDISNLKKKLGYLLVEK